MKSTETSSPESSLKAWKAGTHQRAIEKHPEREAEFKTASGIPVEPIYGEGSEKGAEGLPGEYPYTRGVRPTMYRGRFWTMRQYAGFSSAEDTNERFKLLLDGGQTGLSVAFDLPTQLGYDSDDPLATDEVGLVGVPINSLRDMEILFDQLPLGDVSTSMTINATAPVLVAMYVALCRRQGVEPNRIRGTVQNDILKEYSARGNYRFPVGPSMRLCTDLMAFCAEHAPAWNTISISGYHIREAGSTAVQELAFTLSNGRAYVRAAIDAGLEIDVFAPRLSFFFNAHNDLFEEIAKFRAARRMWARIMKEEFGAKDPRSWMLRFHTQTAGSMLTSQQPDNNVVRVTLQALSAVLGGTQSLHTNSRDEALGLPTADSARLALRTQQIIAQESGVTNVIDPLGGAPFIESLTDEMESRSLELMGRVDERGGAVAAIEDGFVQRQILESALEWQRSVESGTRTIVGVNSYQTDEPPPPIFRPSPEARERVLATLASVKAERDSTKIEPALAAITEAARSGANLMEPIVHAVESYVTLGEISNTLQAEFGKYKAPEVL